MTFLSPKSPKVSDSLPFDPNGYSWIDHKFKSVSGLWNGSSYPVNTKDQFGYHAATAVPSISGGDERYRSEWSITANGNLGIINHALIVLETFGSNGVPNKPDDIESTHGMLAWAISQGVPGDMLQVEFGFPVIPLRNFYEKGYNTLTLSGYVMALPASSSGIMGTHLTVADGGSADINAVDCNVSGSYNKLSYQIIGPNGFILPDKAQISFLNYSISTEWQPFSTDIVFTDNDSKFFYECGRNGCKFQFILGATSHLRLGFLFHPMLLSKS